MTHRMNLIKCLPPQLGVWQVVCWQNVLQLLLLLLLLLLLCL
jgi:hypothetical protein